jgi:GGDEF domain-containing protein
MYTAGCSAKFSPIWRRQTQIETKASDEGKLLDDIATAAQRHKMLAVLVIDLDDFEPVNDTRGHTAGDLCLDQVVAEIGTVLGRRGNFYRWAVETNSLCCCRISAPLRPKRQWAELGEQSRKQRLVRRFT